MLLHLAALAASSVLTMRISAQTTTVVHDGSLSPGVIDISTTGYNVLQSNGVTKNTNLFHSFSQFDIGTQPVTFTGAGVNNIIARVTGGSVSSINGTLRSSIPGANLFLMNPSGIMFGGNAVIDLNGSFVAATSDYIEFSDGFQFSSIPNPSDMILTSAPLSSFGFLSASPAPISVNGDVFSSSGVNRFALIGGDLAISDSFMILPDANVDLVSAGGAGTVGFDPVSPATYPDLSNMSKKGGVAMTNSFLSTSGTGSGRIVIRGGALTLDSSSLNARTSGGNGGGIDVQSDGAVLLTRGSTFSTRSTGTGDAGDIRLTAQSLTMETGGGLPITIGADSTSTGNAGNIDIQVARGISMKDEALVTSTTFGSGSGGKVRVRSRNLEIAGRGEVTGIVAQSHGTGPGGSIDIDVSDRIEMSRGGLISASTFGHGRGGATKIRAGSMRINAGGEAIFTGVAARSNQAGSGGDGGSIRVVVDGELRMVGGGVITTDTVNSGNGGDIDVSAGSIVANGNGSNLNTGITALQSNNGSGNAGDISVNSQGNIRLIGGGQIDSSTFGSGNAGNIDVNSANLYINRAGQQLFTGIGSDSDGSGNGGSIDITTGKIELRRGGLISTGSAGSGEGGKITVRADDIRISGRGTPDATVPTNRSAIFAGTRAGSSGGGGDAAIQSGSLRIRDRGLAGVSSLGSGDAGTLRIESGAIEVRDRGEISSKSEGKGVAGTVRVRSRSNLIVAGNSQITVESELSDAGSALLRANNDVRFRNSTLSVASSGANAGTAIVDAGGFVELLYSGFTARAAVNGGSICIFSPEFVRLETGYLIAEAGNDGGNITIERPVYVLLNDSRVSANAIEGTGGNILIAADVLFANDSEITASSRFGVDGTVRIDALFDLSSSLEDLEDALIDDGQNLQPRCTARIPGETGSMIIVGRGGQPVLPGSFQPAHQLLDLSN